jgi:hypothetical protein
MKDYYLRKYVDYAVVSKDYHKLASVWYKNDWITERVKADDWDFAHELWVLWSANRMLDEFDPVENAVCLRSVNRLFKPRVHPHAYCDHKMKKELHRDYKRFLERSIKDDEIVKTDRMFLWVKLIVVYLFELFGRFQPFINLHQEKVWDVYPWTPLKEESSLLKKP